MKESRLHKRCSGGTTVKRKLLYITATLLVPMGMAHASGPPEGKEGLISATGHLYDPPKTNVVSIQHLQLVNARGFEAAPDGEPIWP